MTKGKIVDLYNNLNSLQIVGNLTGVKLSYAIARNLDIIKPEVEALEKALQLSEDYKKYDSERVKLAEKHAQKGEKGKAMTQKVGNSTKYVMENEEEFNKEFEVLKETHKIVIEAREKQIEEYNELIKEESTIVLHKVTLDDINPEINPVQMTALYPIIQELIPSQYA